MNRQSSAPGAKTARAKAKARAEAEFIRKQKRVKTLIIGGSSVVGVIAIIIGVIILLTTVRYPYYKEVTAWNAKNPNPVVTMEMADGAVVKMELYPQIAPNTVYNFVSLIQKGYYDGVIFHRVMDDFMIQAGDGEEIGYTIPGEFNAAGFKNTLKHTPGVLSTARVGGTTGNPHYGDHSASSQFFICVGVETTASLDGQYAAFGKVIEGMDEVYKISKVETTGQYGSPADRPLEDVVIKKMTVDTFGVTVPQPFTINN